MDVDNNLELKVRDLESKVDEILNILKTEVRPECKKMSSHINFIEIVYDKVKFPLNFICDKINNTTPWNTLTLNKNNEGSNQTELAYQNMLVYNNSAETANTVLFDTCCDSENNDKNNDKKNETGSHAPSCKKNKTIYTLPTVILIFGISIKIITDFYK
tara:strand:+ start:1110 stop:1586 length:477 start_codon:yes stop_codon:yes gene_type:complete